MEEKDYIKKIQLIRKQIKDLIVECYSCKENRETFTYSQMNEIVIKDILHGYEKEYED